MKVLMINGSPHPEGNTAHALAAIGEEFKNLGIEKQTIWIGVKAVQGCIGCYSCAKTGRCVFTDRLYEDVRTALSGADALIVASPTYYAGPNGSLCALLDRVFYSCGPLLRGKPGAAVAIARRGGATTTFERLNKYFQIMGMPMPTSSYWNIAYGRRPGDVEKDAEGIQTLRVLARNMTWLLRAVAANPQPPMPDKLMTNFVRSDLDV